MNRRTFFRDVLAAAAAAWGAPLVATGCAVATMPSERRCLQLEPSETVYVGDAHIFELDWSRATVRPIEAGQ